MYIHDRKHQICIKGCDGILTKSYHCVIIMIEKIKKSIIYIVGDVVLRLDKESIKQYLSEVRDAVSSNRYKLAMNDKRQDNINLFLKYVIDEAKIRDIISRLTYKDFCEILYNNHKGFEHERLYVFGKDILLLERTGTEEKLVSLYIKFNKLDSNFVIVISFHEQKYPLKYYFK